jgi:hypothetical protein
VMALLLRRPTAAAAALEHDDAPVAEGVIAAEGPPAA